MGGFRVIKFIKPSKISYRAAQDAEQVVMANKNLIAKDGDEVQLACERRLPVGMEETTAGGPIGDFLAGCAVPCSLQSKVGTSQNSGY